MQSFSILIVIGVLLILSWIDFKTFLLPDYLTYGLIAYGLLANIFFGLGWASVESSILGTLFGFLSLYILNQLYLKIRGQHGIGMGDAKLLDRKSKRGIPLLISARLYSFYDSYP
jgi:leader peptidase (prepilin peptidase)/N-methyltransferase